MQSLRSVNAVPTRLSAVALRGRTSLRVVASVDWAFEADSTAAGASPASAPSIKLDKLWARTPHRVVIAAKNLPVVRVALPPTLKPADDFGGHTAPIIPLTPVKPDYYHASTAHCVFLVEGVNKDAEEVTISLQRGDRSAAQAKLNGKLLRTEKKTPLRAGDVLQLPGVEYRVTRNTLAHSGKRSF